MNLYHALNKFVKKRRQTKKVTSDNKIDGNEETWTNRLGVERDEKQNSYLEEALGELLQWQRSFLVC
jgi:hypothetical protein